MFRTPTTLGPLRCSLQLRPLPHATKMDRQSHTLLITLMEKNHHTGLYGDQEKKGPAGEECLL